MRYFFFCVLWSTAEVWDCFFFFFQQTFIDHFLVEMHLKIHEHTVKVLKHFLFSNRYRAFLQSEFKSYTPFLASLSAITD